MRNRDYEKVAYYRVKIEYDAKRIISKKTHQYIELIRNELITFHYATVHGIPEQYLERVLIPRKYIYWFFGARFSIDKPYNS